MSVTGIGSSNFSSTYAPETTQSTPREIRAQFQLLGEDLQSGNLTQAQQDFTSLTQRVQSLGSTPIPSGAPPVSSAAVQTYSQLGQDLQSGNLTSAQQDFTTLQSDLQQQGSVQSDGGRHGHFGNLERISQQSNPIAQAFGQLTQSLQSGNTQAAQAAYSALLTDLHQILGVTSAGSSTTAATTPVVAPSAATTPLETVPSPITTDTTISAAPTPAFAAAPTTAPAPLTETQALSQLSKGLQAVQSTLNNIEAELQQIAAAGAPHASTSSTIVPDTSTAAIAAPTSAPVDNPPTAVPPTASTTLPTTVATVPAPPAAPLSAAQAFSQLGQDLQAGNLTLAQQDFATLQSDLQQPQNTASAVGHHHHHGAAQYAYSNLVAELQQLNTLSSAGPASPVGPPVTASVPVAGISVSA